MSFKEKLKKRQLTSLVNPDHPSPSLVHFMGQLKIDAVMIDCEQGAADFTAVEEMSRTARLNNITAIVRVPSPESWTIERYIMRGPDGLVVPRLDLAQQAVRVVEDIRYCAPNDFDRKTVIVQIESASAVNELDGFLDVDDIDCYFIGVVDLAKSMGFRGDYSRPEVVEAIDKSIDRILLRGKTVGIMVKEHDIADWTRKGVTMLYTHLNDFARIGAAQWHQMAGTDKLHV